MNVLTRLLLVIAVFQLSLPAAADPAALSPSRNRCFFVTEFKTWKAPDARTIYVRVGLSRYYRLDLSSSCSSLTWPGAYLVTKFRGSDTVCTALDWDIKVVDDPHGIPTPCIVKMMTELTPAESGAIPRKFKP